MGNQTAGSAASAEGDFRVLKFGGSSLGSGDRIEQVVGLIDRYTTDQSVAVVVSAMGDTTDWLLEAIDRAVAGEVDGAVDLIDRVTSLAVKNARQVAGPKEEADQALVELRHELSEMADQVGNLLTGIALLKEKTPQSRDLILSFGERISARTMAAVLQARGVDAEMVDARDWLVTDARFGEARVDWEATRRRLDERSESWRGRVTVHTGFIGQTPDGRTTTLGRNGSDYTGTLLARGLDAQEIVVWTDVAGIMTADPQIVDDAYPVPRLSYLEALELANYGARMFHNRTMLPLIESGIPMRIQSTMDPEEPGTVIEAHQPGGGDRPTSVTSLENLALIDVRWRELSQQARMGRRVLTALEEAGIAVWMATEAAHGQAVAVVVPRAALEAAEGAIRRELELELTHGEVEPIEVVEPVTLLSLVAEEVRGRENIAGRYFQALGRVGINVRAIAQGESSRSISCVIDAEETAVAVRTVHSAFNFAHQELSLFVLGCGVVGSQLLDQIRAQRDELAAEHDVDVRVVGLADSSTIAFDATGLDLEEGTELVERAGDMANTPENIEALLGRLRRMPVPILVDATAAGGMEEYYLSAFERGVHVVGANKKPVTESMECYRQVIESARSNHRAYHYETTVGASLPVVDTLKNLVRTGDRVHLAEGSLSGTLGYLCNEVMKGVPLSEAVRTAHQRGYTEPNPKDDLSGLDVARKALILARELGLEVELDDVDVEPLVPEAIMETDSIEAFFEALKDYDEAFAERIDAMRRQEKTLRYLAVIDPGEDGESARFEVGPVGVAADHPATRLRGSESFVAFTTDRYEDYPLIVQGAGAGGAVTAAGVLSDIFKIAQNLRGD